ncbi:hypothetical protein NE865_12922 [Phthorimaea operculella]|nr:hypothetical protein NE865_12922 [Phthorimaea operculella]
MKLFCIVVFVISEMSALAHEDNQKTSCKRDDPKCFHGLVKHFIKNAVDGIPEHNVDPLDPLVIPTIHFATHKDVAIHLTDVNITGLNNVEVPNATLNLEDQALQIRMLISTRIKAYMHIEFTAVNTSLRNIKYQGITNSLTINTEYGFEVSPNAEGVDYFTIKREIATKCDTTKDPIVNLDADDLDHILREDPELLQQFIQLNDKGSKVWKNQLICKIAKETISRLMDNFRAVCRILPASLN